MYFKNRVYNSCHENWEGWSFVIEVPKAFAMLMRPNKAETVVHGCHCPGDVAVLMHGAQKSREGGKKEHRTAPSGS